MVVLLLVLWVVVNFNSVIELELSLTLSWRRLWGLVSGQVETNKAR